MPARLTIYLADRPARVLSLRDEAEYVIGRDPASDVFVDDERVSRRHARIRVDGVNRRVTLDDLESTNGTFLRRSPVHQDVPLADGDEIHVGTVELTVHLWASDKAPETKRIRRRNA